jgi:hypothetical protein
MAPFGGAEIALDNYPWGCIGPGKKALGVENSWFDLLEYWIFARLDSKR